MFVEGMGEIDVYSRATKISSRISVVGTPCSEKTAASECPDTIDADALETFTLEEMRALLISYRKRDKDFLIARVTTPDPENHEHFFNFYYSAAEINRVLFRFESNRKLLHRMNVKNPLNNMYIVGQVFYYKISTEDIDKSIVEYFFDFQSKNRTIHDVFGDIFKKRRGRSKSSTNREDISVKEGSLVSKERSRDCLDINEEDLSNESGKSHNNFLGEVIQCMNKGILPIPQNIPAEKKIEYFASYFGTDDDFLLKADVRDYFRQNALEADDDFLYEIDRTRSEFLALLDEDSTDVGEEVSDWRRIFSAHISLAVAMLVVCALLGGTGLALIFFPIAIIIFISFFCSICYVLCCRRSTFDTMAVNTFEDEDM